MDGFDKYSEKTSRDITDIMKGNKFDKICCVITSRPEAVDGIRAWVHITYREADLMKFINQNIQDIVEKFFIESKAKGESLCKLIFSDEPEYSYLLPLAQSRVTLSMICILHEQGRPIGTSREQLYEEIVAFVLSRWEQRHQSLQYKTPRKHILGKYNTVLLKYGQLANFHEEDQEMKLPFTMQEVMSIVGEETLKYGILYKSDPVSHSSDCEFLFVHKTLQEYLAGCYIVQNEMELFMKKCKDMKFLKAEQSLVRFIVHGHLTQDKAAQFVKYLIKSNPTEDLLKSLLKHFLTGYQHEIESEPVIITDKGYSYMYMFPSCVVRYRQSKSHQDYSEYVTINKQCVKINLPQIQDVQSLDVRGDGEFYGDSDVLVSCCRDCEVNLVLHANNLQKLDLRYIKKVGVLEVHGAHHRLDVRMIDVNLNGYLSRTGPWMTNLQSLTMRNCSLCDSDLSDLAACFRSCSQRPTYPEISKTSTG